MMSVPQLNIGCMLEGCNVMQEKDYYKALNTPDLGDERKQCSCTKSHEVVISCQY